MLEFRPARPRRLVAALCGALAAVALTSAPLAAQTRFGQTFVVPNTPNTLLQQITVGPTGIFGSSTGNFFAEIFAYSGGTLVGSSIFSQSLGLTFAGFTIAPGLDLTANATYAVVATASGASSISATVVADYVPGSFINCNGASCSEQFGPADVATFSAQFGPSATVPEPATVALVATGLIALGGVARRRRSA